MAALITNILLVEDNRVNRLVTMRMLERWGYHAMAASNGEQALELAGTYLFDAVLMNLHLPDVQGWELVSSLRMLRPKYITLPIIGISADGGVLKKTEHLFTASLKKPYMPEQLKHLLGQPLANASNKLEDYSLGMAAQIRLVSQADHVFEHQLTSLLIVVCSKMLDDLEAKMLDDVEYLSKIRHKHRSSLRLLNQYAAEAALDNLQAQLRRYPNNYAAVQQRKQTVAKIFRTMLQELKALHQIQI